MIAADLRRLDVSFRQLSRAFQVPKEWVIFERASILTLGLCTELDPTLNPMTVIRPYLERFVLGDQDWSGILVETSRDILLGAAALLLVVPALDLATNCP